MIPLYQVDAFTDTPFGGNPAAVCILEHPRDDGWMQAVAAEMNLSETAFLEPLGEEWRLRWFTPAQEVDLCGHATLASAHLLWESGRLVPEAEARFQTRSGLLVATRRERGIELVFPADGTTPVGELEMLEAIVGQRVVAAHRGREDRLVELESEEALRACRPDLARLKALPIRGLIVTAPGDGGGFDFLSRFFAPAAGIDEDPVTGSAHCTLATYWARKLGKTTMNAWQASDRGGRIGVRLEGTKVHLTGGAVTVSRGELLA